MRDISNQWGLIMICFDEIHASKESRFAKAFGCSLVVGFLVISDTSACLAASSLWQKLQVPEERAAEVKVAVKSNLLDPESAQFRNLYTPSVSSKPMPSGAVCGEVNAKNGYGGYVGFKKFVQSAPGKAPLMWKNVDWEDVFITELCHDS
ncbi:hypothetical protein JFU49_16825 [Pseudomonas sp. TH03]|uniref:hypothetical protein n=1 Tax=Pseudomonas sp. TH03 TaxID=2796369 RepID=UPI00191477DC|nr:hypothetical protein [Pseudomonas sp. TH03]MBK5551925.1 hypothetical protein [Pseudomonas sp. TH03]